MRSGRLKALIKLKHEHTKADEKLSPVTSNSCNQLGYVNERGAEFSPSSVQSMIAV
jgi:hypothetical protein